MAQAANFKVGPNSGDVQGPAIEAFLRRQVDRLAVVVSGEIVEKAKGKSKRIKVKVEPKEDANTGGAD
ncbi:MAG: hypothetical protein ACREO5_11140 [Candidatus Binatia bacterium]